LNKAGHKVTVFERDNKPGGILRYGIPDFKLEKWILDRRIKLLEKEGIVFKTKTAVDSKPKGFDAIVLAGGSRVPRDLSMPGRDLKGIHFAMDYLSQANKVIEGEKISDDKLITAKGKKVVVIGGGDTGADCVGVAHRQGAKCVIQIELFPQPSTCRPKDMPWPKYPLLLKTSTSHEEGGERKWSISTKAFLGENKKVKKLSCINVEFEKDSKGCPVIKEVAGSEFQIPADLVVLALGFLHPEKKGLVEALGLEHDQRGNVKTDDNYMTSQKGVFAAGDMRRGQSLIVWAISEGRRCAHNVDKYLMGSSNLPIL
jgi:glutamate synthase (NADPH/NADH) small chain